MQGEPKRDRAGGAPASAGRAGRGVPAPLFYGLVGLLMLANAFTAVAFLMSPDIARLMSDETEQILAAYEERINQLRIEVDRLHSRNYAQAGDLNLQLQDLAQQQELLAEQHQLIQVLVGKASELGIEAASLPAPASRDVSTLYVPATGNLDVAATAAAVGSMMDETRWAMSAISASAAGKTDAILGELRGLGIRVPLPDDVPLGMGGPLLPPIGDAAAADLVDDANAVLAALYRYQAALSAIDRAPVHMPIAGSFRTSSGFGNRRDPFSGARAFHAGLDFAAPTGTAIVSAGAGEVVFAGTRSGYGKVVEIAHDGGLLTRYAHMSAILVSRGQAVQPGTPIGKVGSTGRSTGPHLHFEVRKSDTPLDPAAFLDSGRRLLQLI